MNIDVELSAAAQHVHSDNTQKIKMPLGLPLFAMVGKIVTAHICA